MAFSISKNRWIGSMLGIIFIIWFVIVYLFSSQTGAESTKLSNQVTKKLLQIKDTLAIVIENYEHTNEIVLKRN